MGGFSLQQTIYKGSFVIIALIAAVSSYIFIHDGTLPNLLFIHSTELQTFKTMLISILLESVPFIFLGAFISSILHVFVPEQFIRRLIPRNPLLGMLNENKIVKTNYGFIGMMK